MNSLILCEIDNHPEKQVEIRYLLPHMPSHVIIKQMLKGGGGLPTSPVKKMKLRTVPELTQDRATRASSWAPAWQGAEHWGARTGYAEVASDCPVTAGNLGTGRAARLRTGWLRRGRGCGHRHTGIPQWAWGAHPGNKTRSPAVKHTFLSQVGLGAGCPLATSALTQGQARLCRSPSCARFSAQYSTL